MAAARRQPKRLALIVSAGLVGCCAAAAFWITTLTGPPAGAPLSFQRAGSPAAVAETASTRTNLYLPLSPLVQHDVQAVGGTSPRPGDGLRIRLPATLPPAHRIPSLPITVPLRPGFFADTGSGYDEFALDEVNSTPDGTLPLLWVEGEEDTWLTPNFRIADFVSRDGDATARISYRLVDGLERLRDQAGSLGILSGYRNTAHNAAVGGVAHSKHLEGKAADIWSADQDPLDLARLALQTIGCEIGLGLGPRSLHVDVRGELTTWAYPGAAMPDAAFDAWALAQCGLPVPAELAREAAISWLAESTVAGLDTLYDDASPTDLLARFHADVIEAARAGYDLEGPGAVILDLRAGVPPTAYLPPDAVRYVPAASPEAGTLGVSSLIAWRERGRQRTYFVYAVLTPSAAPAVGVSSFTSLQSAPEPAPEPVTAGPPAPATSRAAPLGGAWTVVVASHVVSGEARSSAARYEATLREEDHVIDVVHDTAAERYRVTVGQFRTSAAAQNAIDRLGDKVPSDAWVYRR